MSAYIAKVETGEVRVKDAIYPPSPWLSITDQDGATVGVSLTPEQAREIAANLIEVAGSET